jgi:hypothetical protein
MNILTFFSLAGGSLSGLSLDFIFNSARTQCKKSEISDVSQKRSSGPSLDYKTMNGRSDFEISGHFSFDYIPPMFL